MRYTILFITLLSCFFVSGQTATEYFDEGRTKQERNDFEGAVKEYSKAIEIDATFAEAYYSRASLFYDNDNFEEALADLDKTISLRPDPIEFYMAALELRAKSNLKIGNRQKACNDFIEAKQLGASIDKEYLELCEYKGIKNEYFFVKMYDKKNWEITNESYKNNQRIILMANKNSDYLSLISNIGMKNTDIAKAMDASYKMVKGKSQDAQLSLLEKDVKAKEPWIMYLIQNVINEDCNCKETQVWYLIQGENCFHSCCISIRNDLFTPEKKEEIIRTFTTAKIIYQ